MENLPLFIERVRQFNAKHPELVGQVHNPGQPGLDGRHLLTMFDPDRLRRVMRRVLDETEFLSDYGIRSLSRFHQDHPFVFQARGQEYRVDYMPAESTSSMFGGNSNWRGPIWFPVNMLTRRRPPGLLRIRRR